MTDRNDTTYIRLRAILAQAYRDSMSDDPATSSKATQLMVGLNHIGPELGFDMNSFRADARNLAMETTES